MKQTVREFLGDDCPRMAAALSYYTVFSLPAILVLVMVIAGAFWEPVELRGQLVGQLEMLIGQGAAEQVREILANARRPGSGGPLAIGLSVGALLFAATGALAQLQAALNRAWEVGPDPDLGGIRNFLMKRALSLAMILGIAALLLLSLLAQWLLAGLGDLIASAIPGALSGVVLQGVNLVLTLGVTTLLFAALFHVVPDARVEWRDAWRGAAATAVLFVVGNLLLGLYLARSQPGSAFGAAGSLALILVWVYYSSMIFFLGAELTQVLADRRGATIRPAQGAVRVVTEQRTLREE